MQVIENYSQMQFSINCVYSFWFWQLVTKTVHYLQGRHINCDEEKRPTNANYTLIQENTVFYKYLQVNTTDPCAVLLPRLTL